MCLCTSAFILSINSNIEYEIKNFLEGREINGIDTDINLIYFTEY